ncbi:FGGY-family carbohydrate kinase [Eubacterium sp.]|uniref:FGGY-family carbohydrate kinase n=1 Tax=Eubacterium sp. TaxID=142586 RepID=UPI002FC6C464
MKYIIGIDAGTSNVKAVLFDTAGKELAVESLENEPIYIGDVEVEQNMNLLWDKVALCIKNLVASGPAKAEEILGIGVTAQGEGIWLIDGDGQPVQDAILWCDGRATEEVRVVTEDDPQLGALIHRITGTPALTGTQLMLLSWMKNNRKEVLDQASHMLFCKDWVRYKLTGLLGGDLSDTGTSLMNSDKGVVAEDLLETLGLGEYISYIPEISTSDTIAGGVTADMAEFLGLTPGTPVITGAIDVVASAVGIGAVGENDVCVILGTTCANESFIKRERCEFGKEGTRYEKHAVGDLFMNLMPTMNGTPNLDWVLEEIAMTKDFSKIDIMIADVPAGSGGVIYHPYISAAGERAPFYNPDAKANFFGISAKTGRAELTHAVYEGITLSIKDCLADVAVDANAKVYLAGGGAKSAIWAQMIADVLGMQVVISDGAELGAKGAAMMMGVAAGEYKNYIDAARQCCRATQVYFPNLENTAIYQEIYTLYKAIRVANADLWHERARLLKRIKNGEFSIQED